MREEQQQRFTLFLRISVASCAISTILINFRTRIFHTYRRAVAKDSTWALLITFDYSHQLDPNSCNPTSTRPLTMSGAPVKPIKILGLLNGPTVESHIDGEQRGLGPIEEVFDLPEYIAQVRHYRQQYNACSVQTIAHYSMTHVCYRMACLILQIHLLSHL